MCDHFDWVRYGDDREDAFQSFRIALTKEFNTQYGTDVDNLAAWQKLCVRLGTDPVPQKIRECREVCSQCCQNNYSQTDMRCGNADSHHHPCKSGRFGHYFGHCQYFQQR